MKQKLKTDDLDDIAANAAIQEMALNKSLDPKEYFNRLEEPIQSIIIEMMKRANRNKGLTDFQKMIEQAYKLKKREEMENAVDHQFDDFHDGAGIGINSEYFE